MCASRPGTAGRPPRGPGPAAPGVVLRVREGTRTRGISGPRVRLSPFLLLFPALRARTLGGSWLQSFRGRRGLRRARRRAGCGRGEARTDALLAASLFRSGGETWRGVSRGGPGLSAATFRARRGLFVPSPISSFRHPPPPTQLPTLVPSFQASFASSLYTPHPQNCTNPKSLKSGMGKEERWGRRCAMGRVPPERWMFALECRSFCFCFFSLP